MYDSFVGPIRPEDKEKLFPNINAKVVTHNGAIAPTKQTGGINTTPTYTDKPVGPGINKETGKSSVTSPVVSPVENEITEDKKSDGVTAPSATPLTVQTAEPTGSEKYYEMQKEYIEKYLGRDPFEYDVNADEIYKIYRAQALEQADRARRDTVAKAAGLTGGYGSTYAARAGADAYNDVMSGVDEMIPELYEAALGRYNAEGEAMLERADIAGEHAEALEEEALGNIDYYGISDGTWDMEQKLKTAKGIYDYKGENDTGATIYDEVMRIYGGKATGSNAGVKDKYLGEHKDYTADQIRDELMTWELADGSHLSEKEVNYLIGAVTASRTIDALSNMVASDGKALGTYIEELASSGLGAEEIYAKLSAFADKSGTKLTEQEILALMQYM